MLSTIAAVAGLGTVLIGLGYQIAAAIHKRAYAKKMKSIQGIYELIKEAKTNEERDELQKALNDLLNP